MLSQNSEKNSTKARTLVIIVAYEAARHIEGVLDRFPLAVWNQPEWEVLCLDDASSDTTALLARRWAEKNGAANLTVLKNPENQGYGGNQKLGFQYAIRHGFQRVILIHGDGQYAPEMVPEIAVAMCEHSADVFLGARTWSYWAARMGGMPAYKYFGNKFLTKLQNLMTGKKLIEYHTGLRGYSVEFLRGQNFELNSNDFHFDTEILLQAFHCGAKIIERQISPHYGDEICRVNGTVYAWRVFWATVHYALIRVGFLNSPQFRRKAASHYTDKTSSQWSSHGRVLKEITTMTNTKSDSTRILDIGCGQGHLARKLIDQGFAVSGIDHSDFSGSVAWHQFDIFDLDNIAIDNDRSNLPCDASDFDYLCCLDVIEHLKRPEELLLAIRASQRSLTTPVIFICTPNVAFLSVRLSLLLGFFNYSERGILDIDHARLFTKDSFLRLIRNSGYRVEKLIPLPAPWDFQFRGYLGVVAVRIHGALAAIWPSLFAFQMLAVVKPQPNLDATLNNTFLHSSELPEPEFQRKAV